VKINPGWRPLGKQIQLSDSPLSVPASPKSFADVLKQHNGKADLDQLNRMLRQIQLQGERLSRSLTIRELRDYKRLVKQFLEHTVRAGIGLKTTTGWDRRGRSKRYKILEEIDRKLVELGEEMLSEEAGKIELLQKIGEIRGLLINLLY
jgi:uncharacterized protein YaaR (DUF327 family)